MCTPILKDNTCQTVDFQLRQVLMCVSEGGIVCYTVYVHVIMHLTENGSVIEEYIIFMMPL